MYLEGQFSFLIRKNLIREYPWNPRFRFKQTTQTFFSRNFFSASSIKRIVWSLNFTKMIIGFTVLICVLYSLLLFSRIRFKPTLRRKYCWSKRPIPLNEVLHYCVRWLSNENQGKRVCIERRCFRQNSLKCE